MSVVGPSHTINEALSLSSQINGINIYFYKNIKNSEILRLEAIIFSILYYTIQSITDFYTLPFISGTALKRSSTKP